MERLKIPHSTCEHDRVRFFTRLYPDESGFARRSRNPRYEGASNLRAARLRLGKAGAKDGRRGPLARSLRLGESANPTIYLHSLRNRNLQIED